jgi:hypothetical protein
MLHVAPRATFSALRAIQQAAQKQPCSSDSLTHSSSSRAGGTGDPLSVPHPVQQQQQQQPEQPCMQQHALGSSLQLLPLVAAHQLWTTMHSLPVHAAETIPPEAVALFREFLVGCSGAARSGLYCHGACSSEYSKQQAWRPTCLPLHAAYPVVHAWSTSAQQMRGPLVVTFEVSCSSITEDNSFSTSTSHDVQSPSSSRWWCAGLLDSTGSICLGIPAKPPMVSSPAVAGCATTQPPLHTNPNV